MNTDERIRLNAIIYNQREKLRGLNETRDLLRNKVKKLEEQLKDANEVIKWYDGLENILIGWELITGQTKGTAKEYLEKWGVK